MDNETKQPSALERAQSWAVENEVGKKVLKALPWVAGAFLLGDAINLTDMVPNVGDKDPEAKIDWLDFYNDTPEA